MRPRLRDEYGAPTRVARHAGIAAGLLSVCALGFALGRMNSAASQHPQPAGQSAVPLLGGSAPASSPSPDVPTKDAAVGAAVHADCVLGGPLVLNPAAYRTALSTVLAPDKAGSAAGLASDESAQLDAETGAVTAAGGGTHVYITCVPLAYRVETFAPGAAAVSVWTEQIVAIEGSFAPASAYVTETLDMVWTAAGWRLETSQLLDTHWAPTPVESPLPQAGSLPAQMTTFTPLGGG